MVQDLWGWRKHIYSSSEFHQHVRNKWYIIIYIYRERESLLQIFFDVEMSVAGPLRLSQSFWSLTAGISVVKVKNISLTWEHSIGRHWTLKTSPQCVVCLSPLFLGSASKRCVLSPALGKYLWLGCVMGCVIGLELQSLCTKRAHTHAACIARVEGYTWERTTIQISRHLQNVRNIRTKPINGRMHIPRDSAQHNFQQVSPKTTAWRQKHN